MNDDDTPENDPTTPPPDPEIFGLTRDQHRRSQALDIARGVLASRGPLSSSAADGDSLVLVANWVITGEHHILHPMSDPNPIGPPVA